MSERAKVVIIGGGFGGLSAAQALKSAPVDVTLLDRRNQLTSTASLCNGWRR